MKKILSLVLMMMTVATVTLWAKPFSSKAFINGEKYTLVTNTENVVLQVDDLTDFTIVKMLVDAIPPEVNGECVDVLFNDTITEVAKKYPSYWLISKDGKCIYMDNSLSDGRMVRLVVLIK